MIKINDTEQRAEVIYDNRASCHHSKETRHCRMLEKLSTSMLRVDGRSQNGRDRVTSLSFFLLLLLRSAHASEHNINQISSIIIGKSMQKVVLLQRIRAMLRMVVHYFTQIRSMSFENTPMSKQHVCKLFYQLSIVGLNLCLSCTVTDIFSVEFYQNIVMTLKSGLGVVQRH